VVGGAILVSGCLGLAGRFLVQGQLAAPARTSSREAWFAFNPGPDKPFAGNPIDLRALNEKIAGQGGFIAAKDGHFVHGETGVPVRFWGVNGPSGQDVATLRREARKLAGRGVNLVRYTEAIYDKAGQASPQKVAHVIDVVEAMKPEGIYTHFSLFFPLGLHPTPETPFLRGYQGKKPPFCALFFNPDFQKQYLSWWKALLLTPSKTSGKWLIDDPAVAGVEILNEDSFFFWTFTPDNVPEPQLAMLEKLFGEWLAKRYGSIDAAVSRWAGVRTNRDRPEQGRLGFRPLYNLFMEKSVRDQDTARFLTETQRNFYESTYKFLRKLGFQGVITASNWTTASTAVLGPLEKFSYTAGDFLDRHGYLSCHAEGPNATWAITPGITYVDRSALRFDPEVPGKPRLFANPVMYIKYAGKPSMVSELAWNRPNRFRSEAPLYLAAYGALQDVDALVHFADDTPNWSAKPNPFMQPWTLMSPAMMGQFPAAALIYRKALIGQGDLLAEINLGLEDLFALKGTPLQEGAGFDELRARDIPAGTTLKPGNVIDPLIHYAGRTSVSFSEQGGSAVLKDLHPMIDRAARTVTSSNGQLRLDYGKGFFTMNAPAVQGVSGALNEAGTVELNDLSITSLLPIGHIVAVSLDDRPLATSQRFLLQVMSEEKATGFRTQPGQGGKLKVLDIGRDPWTVRAFEGTVRLKRPDASTLVVKALDPNGQTLRSVRTGAEIRLGSTILYYLIEPAPSQ
jgi:hypothetical protein